MWKSLLLVWVASVLVAASPAPREREESSARPIHIIKPPVRCPEGMRPDANGRCRVVWERSADGGCPEGEGPDDEGACREMAEGSDCLEDECLRAKVVEKRDVGERELEDQTESMKSMKKHKRMEALKSERKSKKRSNAEDGKSGKQARSKHAFLIMLKKKKMHMMKPKPPAPPPPPHHPPHHHPPHHQESEEEPEEEPAEEEEQPEQPEQPALQRLFFGDEACVDRANSTVGCGAPDAEIVEVPDPKNEFTEWTPGKSSESSSSSSSSSSSDSTGESESGGGSGDSEDEVLEKAIKIKLMKLFRMKQRYGPALRRWLVTQLREYEDSFGH